MQQPGKLAGLLRLIKNVSWDRPRSSAERYRLLSDMGFACCMMV